MTWLVTGADGQLGTSLEVLGDFVQYGRAELDVTDRDMVMDVVQQLKPEVVINAAAYTKVDQAETGQPTAWQVNAIGPRNLAEAAATVGARLIHVSTDYVFDGSATSPIDEATPANPINAYGRSKAAGESHVLAYPNGFVVRTSWLYGKPGPNFVLTMLRLSESNEPIRVVNDQFGSPTYANDLAAGLISLGLSGAPAGVYHRTNSGSASWYEFACAIFDLAGLDSNRISPIETTEFKRPAPRPRYTVLSNQKWDSSGLGLRRDWKAALEEYLILCGY